MKKLLTVLMTLCLLCTAVSALAEDVPTWDSMPDVVVEDDTTTVEKSAFDGTWVLDKAFLGEAYIDVDALKETTGVTVPTFTIEDGTLRFTDDDGNGGTAEKEIACVFDAGQLQGEAEGVSFVFELLVDGNIVMTYFLKGEGDETICLTLFLVRAEA